MPSVKTLRRHAVVFAGAATATAALALPSSSLATSCTGANVNPTQLSLPTARRATLCLLNQQRRAHGLRPLRESHKLDRASQQHARDMVAHHYFAHGDYLNRIRDSSYLSGASSWMVGENIAYGTGYLATPAAIVNMWMHSPEHRANILRPQFRQIGLGIARGAPVSDGFAGGTYDTDFGRR